MSWKNEKLTEICTVTTGKWDANHASEKGKFRFYTCASKFLLCNTKRYDGKNIILPGNGANVGDVYFYDGAFDAYQRTYVLSDIKIVPEYLYYHLQSNWEETNRFKQYGSATNFLKIGNFKDYNVCYPTLPIQQKIVKKLDAIFAEIDKAIAVSEANIKNTEALFQSYLRQVFEQDREGWKKIYLKDIAEYFNGLTYSPKNVCENGTIVLRSSNIQKDKIDLDDIVRVDSAIKDKLYVKSGDILMCSRNGSQRLVGKTATIDDLNESMTFGTFMMIIRSDNNFFLKWFFKSDLFKRQITSGENTMINQITRYMLDEIVLSLPDVLTQKLISNKISNLFVNTQKLKSNYLSKINELSLEKQSILKQAFNGELVKAA